jgi:hypothetical protein
MVSTAACGFQQQTGTPYSEREKDVYAIYSLMLANPRTSHGPYESERLLIARTTRPASVPILCMRPPKEREAEFREVLADYQRRTDIPRELRPMLAIPEPYTLLTADEVSAFIADRDAQVRGAPESERFRGVSDYFTLADVSFNQNGRLALTALSSWCGGLCGESQWRVFEKLDSGKWQNSGGDCAWLLTRTGA